MKLHLVVGCVLVGLMSSFLFAGAGDAAVLDGTWLAVAVEQGGSKVPDDYIKEVPHTMTFKNGRYVVTELGKVLETGTYKLDVSKNPPTIDLRIETGDDKGKMQLGIFKVASNRLTLALAKEGSRTRPTAFASKEGDEHQLTVWTKTNEPDRKSASPPKGG